MQRWVVLLRAVNVGGRNRVPMGELRESLETRGFIDVRTYIQSGNIGLSHDGPVEPAAIEALLRERFDVDTPAVVVATDEVARIFDANPFALDDVNPAQLHVFFLGAPVHDVERRPLDPDRFAPDRIEVCDGAVYVLYATGAGKSRLTVGAVERAVGRVATARNLRTVERLMTL